MRKSFIKKLSIIFIVSFVFLFFMFMAVSGNIDTKCINDLTPQEEKQVLEAFGIEIGDEVEIVVFRRCMRVYPDQYFSIELTNVSDIDAFVSANSWVGEPQKIEKSFSDFFVPHHKYCKPICTYSEDKVIISLYKYYQSEDTEVKGIDVSDLFFDIYNKI